MRVAIDVSPLKSAHKFRGVGHYTKRLVKALKKVDKKNQYLFITNRQALVRTKADIVHHPYFDLFWLTLPLIKKQKTVVTIHDVIPLVFPKHFPPGIKGKLKFQKQKLALKTVNAIICDSKNSKKDIVKYLNFPQEKIFVVYLAAGKEFKPLSTKVARAVLSKYKLPRRFVLYVGDVNYHKNILGLVKASKKIKIPLVIVGKQAAQKKFDQTHIENQPLVQLIKLYGKDSRVIRLGFVPEEDLVAIYNLATAYCQPSFYEGFGLPVLEAMACGTPVVAAKTSSLPEVCGRAAIMVDPYDINDIANGLTVAIEDEDLRGGLIQRGLKQAKKFSWEKTANETYKVYQKVVRE